MSQSLSPSTSQAVTQAPPTQSVATPTQVAQQPYGNQAALEDAGLVDDYSTMYLEEADEEWAYIQLLGWAQIDWATALATCLADPTRPSAQRWLAHYTLDDVAAEAPEMLDTAREIVWPVGRRIKASVEGGMTIAGLGGGVTGDVETERGADGFTVELAGEMSLQAGLSLPGMSSEVEEALNASRVGPRFGSDVSVGLGASAGAGVSGGYELRLGWELATDAMDGVLGGFPCLPALDALVRSIDMLLSDMPAPESVEATQKMAVEADASLGVGVGLEVGAEIEGSAGYGMDSDVYYSFARISAGVSAGFDWGLMQALLEDPALVDLASKYSGDVQARVEIPKDKFPDPHYAKFFFCWATTAGEASSSTWVEIGALPSAVDFLWSLLGGSSSGGVMEASKLPDRTLVRSAQRPVEDEAQVATLSELVDRPGDAYGRDVRTTIVAKGSVRVDRVAVWAALGGAAETFDTCGESAEDALLDAERQIAARFLGEAYEWPGARQLEGGLDLAVEMCEVAESRVEVTTEIEREASIEGEHHHEELGVELASSIAYTSVLEVPPEQLQEFMCA